ncbi:MAG TPA: histidine phosphatase family protein [Nocardioides sp.]|uniref:histidine phosphatase family protein n=1 Tax=Nocardioides sp. TaxID=35761 RepID=UPI002E2F2AAE|nr:histidine phosphatase family protein [Nocardioides sp.]HEX5086583.1 histidine phosphatase family protein [Nocardioides sp.]
MGVLMLVRHGQASFGTVDYDELSSRGVRQSRKVAETLAGYGVSPTSLIHGGMRRQQETAEQMLLGAPSWSLEPETDVRWRELDHLAVMNAYPTTTDRDRELIASGGMELRAFYELYAKATARWASGAYDADYPESFADFIGRIRSAIGHAARMAGERRTAVVVTSGGPIAAACAMLTEVGEEPRRLSASWARFNAVIVNASVTRIVVGSTGARLLTFNEHSALDRELVTYR